MHIRRNGFPYFAKGICHAAIIASLMLPPADTHACSITYDMSITEDLSQKIIKKIVKPLRKVQKEVNVTLNEVVHAYVQTKIKADKIHNIEMDTATIFRNMLIELREKHAITFPKKQVNNFVKKLQECEKKMTNNRGCLTGKKGWWLSCEMKASRHKEPVESNEEEEMSVPLALTLLEGLCGSLLFILGAHVGKLPGCSGVGKSISGVGVGMFGDMIQRLFRPETYEKEQKKTI